MTKIQVGEKVEELETLTNKVAKVSWQIPQASGLENASRGVELRWQPIEPYGVDLHACYVIQHNQLSPADA